ncbi:glycoside hydrolase family 10 protein [Pontibacter diazotrophicus]|uniref:glycoside hydrolase family 10 protein n=1 Tax=Pontibacter diazotrophicus TaxID=1400979 RepID=UPI001C69E60C|nr:family 10 glycosylhydrolase [Pontibacter diazotrophicus]
MIKKLVWPFMLVLVSNMIHAQENGLSPKREFRGVWVATVSNIDWPSKPAPGTTSSVQKQELIQILDEHQKTGINAIMLQVRPSTDAFYAKSREQWSMFLTGKQGVAPQPFYDPLEFAIEEAHKRGMELHAWFNPYRATNNLIDSLTSAAHITRTQPDLFFTYGGKKYFNPGLPEVRAYITGVIMDVVRNYDIDGVHFDDYFYPYPGKEALPDSITFQQYNSGFDSIEDWRRNNVDVLIQALSDSIHAEKNM